MTDDQQPTQGPTGATPTEQAQIQRILQVAPEAVPFPGTPGAEVEYLYRRNKIIVRDANLDSVTRGLDGRRVANSVDREFPLVGVTRLTLPETNEGDAERSLAAEIRRIEAVEGPRAAGLDHLFYVCGHSCAAIEPERAARKAIPVPRPQIGQDAAVPRSRHGKKVRVLVMDTGLVERAAQDHAWMTGVDGDIDTLVRPDGTILQDGGHGTFVAGCVRVTAPEAKVHVVNAAQLLAKEDGIGAAFESDLADLVRKHLVADDDQPPLRVPDILVLNFAGTTQGGRPPVALAALYDSVIQHVKELLILSPAGNEGDRRKNWPASFAWVVSVGGLAANWRDRASWSNHGHNVDVYAPGDRLVNAFATGHYVCGWDPLPHEVRIFKGMALWSGTSFSTPLVAGLVASRMSTTGQSSRRAWESLFDLAERQAVPGVGPVLYPGQELA